MDASSTQRIGMGNYVAQHDLVSNRHFTDVKIKKIVLYTLSGLALAAGCTAIALAAAHTIIPLAWPALPILIVASAALISISIGLFYGAKVLKDYENPKELEKIREKAASLTFEQLVKDHGLENIREYQIVDLCILKQKFEEAMQNLTFSGMVQRYSLETISRYNLCNIGFLQAKFEGEMAEVSFSEIIHRYSLETINIYKLCHELFLQDKFQKELCAVGFSSVVRNHSFFDTIIKNNLCRSSLLQEEFQKELYKVGFHKIVQKWSIAFILEKNLAPLDLLQREFIKYVRSEIMTFTPIPGGVQISSEEIEKYRDCFRQLVSQYPISVMRQYNLLPQIALDVCLNIDSASINFEQTVAQFDRQYSRRTERLLGEVDKELRLAEEDARLRAQRNASEEAHQAQIEADLENSRLRTKYERALAAWQHRQNLLQTTTLMAITPSYHPGRHHHPRHYSPVLPLVAASVVGSMDPAPPPPTIVYPRRTKTLEQYLLEDSYWTANRSILEQRRGAIVSTREGEGEQLAYDIAMRNLRSEYDTYTVQQYNWLFCALENPQQVLPSAPPTDL